MEYRSKRKATVCRIRFGTVVQDLPPPPFFFFFFFLGEMMVHARLSCKEGCGVIGEGAAGGLQRELSNDARSKFLQGTSASFSFFITRESKNRNGVGS